jgi:hypothetical protein
MSGWALPHHEQGLCGHLLAINSMTETRALFLATSFQHEATALGGHSGAESMGALAFNATRLICAFHKKNRSFCKSLATFFYFFRRKKKPNQNQGHGP